MSKQRRQQLLLALLLIALLVVAWRQIVPLWRGADGRSAAGRTAGSGGDRGFSSRATDLPQVVDLRLSDLETSREELEEGRDPFNIRRPKPATPPSESKPSASELRQAMERARAQAQAQSTADARPPAPRPPPVDIVFLGSFGPETRRLAVFTDGREIFNAREGEVVKERFIVVRIGFESADLGFVGFPQAPAQRLEIGG